MEDYWKTKYLEAILVNDSLNAELVSMAGVCTLASKTMGLLREALEDARVSKIRIDVSSLVSSSKGEVLPALAIFNVEVLDAKNRVVGLAEAEYYGKIGPKSSYIREYKLYGQV